MKLGKVFMFHTGSAIPLVLDGVTDQPLLTREKMLKPDNDKRCIIVGIWDWAQSPIPNKGRIYNAYDNIIFEGEF